MSDKTIKSTMTQTNDKIDNTFDMVENSNIGKSIPKTIPELHIIDIVKTLFSIKLLYIAPYYLIINSGSVFETKFLKSISIFFKSLSSYILLGDLIVGAAQYFLRIKHAMIVLILFCCLKLLSFLLITFTSIFTNLSFLSLLFYIMFLCSFVGIDFAYGFYLHFIIKNNIKDNSIPKIDAKEDENI